MNELNLFFDLNQKDIKHNLYETLNFKERINLLKNKEDIKKRNYFGKTLNKIISFIFAFIISFLIYIIPFILFFSSVFLLPLDNTIFKIIGVFANLIGFFLIITMFSKMIWSLQVGKLPFEDDEVFKGCYDFSYNLLFMIFSFGQIKKIVKQYENQLVASFNEKYYDVENLKVKLKYNLLDTVILDDNIVKYELNLDESLVYAAEAHNYLNVIDLRALKQIGIEKKINFFELMTEFKLISKLKDYKNEYNILDDIEQKHNRSNEDFQKLLKRIDELREKQ